ncbi:MAG TPA: DUF6600 domain-containing protein [Candidatus Limnocylindrales bacterium]|nr:DUF6600 domain-containing protein [Candidatus Limnocylindrales bacterium]
MRRNSLLALLPLAVLLAGMFALRAQAGGDGYSYARIVRLSLVSGDVQVMRAEESKWEPALLNMPIQQGFVLGTNNGRAEVEFENGGAMWVADNSIVQFTELALADGGLITRIAISEGTATFRPSLTADDSFHVKAGELDLRPFAKSEFRVDIEENRQAVSVFNGRVEVSSPAGPKTLAKGEAFVLNANAVAEASITRNRSADGWDRWVDTRANAISSGQTQTLQYANTNVGYGMDDLSTYGSWGFFPGIGYGWQPFGAGAGWAPFCYGQWGFYPGFGWTWISAEPWGWVPYHFGGWSFSPVFGWVWMPGGFGYWSPAPVQWVNVGNRMGWIPRSAANSPAVHTGAAAASTPVILSTKELGKGGVNKVVTQQEIGGRMEILPAAPAGRGKFASQTAGLVAPTAASLHALRTEAAIHAGGGPIVNGATAGVAPDLVASNGAPLARKNLPGPPPIRYSSSFGGSSLHGPSGFEAASTHAGGASHSGGFSSSHSGGASIGHSGGGGGGGHAK